MIMRIGSYINPSRLGRKVAVVILKPRLEEGSGLLLYTDTPARIADCVLSGGKASPKQTKASPRKSCYTGIYAKMNDWVLGNGPWITVSFTLDKDK
jgi:hypothetical protein